MRSVSVCRRVQWMAVLFEHSFLRRDGLCLKPLSFVHVSLFFLSFFFLPLCVLLSTLFYIFPSTPFSHLFTIRVHSFRHSVHMHCIAHRNSSFCITQPHLCITHHHHHNVVLTPVKHPIIPKENSFPDMYTFSDS